MQKGQGAVAAIAVSLIVGVIMVTIVAGLTTPMSTPYTVLNESLGNVSNATITGYDLGQTCLTSAPTSFVDWNTGLELTTDNYTVTTAGGAYPNTGVTNVVFTAADTFSAEGNIVGTNYSYSCTYTDNSLIQIITGNIPVLFGVLLLMVAVGAAMLGK